jgi:hypothetical protein
MRTRTPGPRQRGFDLPPTAEERRRAEEEASWRGDPAVDDRPATPLGGGGRRIEALIDDPDGDP